MTLPPSSSLSSASLLIQTKNINKLTSIKLNRPKQLNALNTEMVQSITNIIQSKYKIFVISSTSKHFCAGGDVKSLTSTLKSPNEPPNTTATTDTSLQKNFFKSEYNLNYLLSTKNTISLITGICFGGGMGIGINSKYKVSFDAVFSMPECAIGLYPDVGMSYYLSRLKDYRTNNASKESGKVSGLGMYLALTGHKVSAKLGAKLFCDYYCEKSVEEVEERLSDCETEDDVLKLFDEICINSNDLKLTEELVPSEVLECFEMAKDIDDLYFLLESNNTNTADVIKTLRKSSQTSLGITFKQIKNAAKLSLKDCLKQDYCISKRILEANLSGRNRDFVIGVDGVFKKKEVVFGPRDDVEWYFKELGDELIFDENDVSGERAKV